MLHDFRRQHRLGAGQRLSKRLALRARRRSRSPFRPILILKRSTDAFPTSPPRSIPSTRTLQARIETNNPGEKLKKDMYVVATVNAGKIQNAIAVPDAAVLRDSENQPFVYAAAAANQFGRRSVTLGESLNGQTQITSGLKAGRPGRSEMAACSCSLRTRCSVSRPRAL